MSAFSHEIGVERQVGSLPPPAGTGGGVIAAAGLPGTFVGVRVFGLMLEHAAHATASIAPIAIIVSCRISTYPYPGHHSEL
jgi:hypothetical protein